MGLDSVFIVAGHVNLTPSQTVDYNHAVYSYPPMEEQRWEHDTWNGRNVTVFHASMRAYLPGYERGSWPVIAGVIDMLVHLFGEGSVWYTDDASWSHQGERGGVNLVTREWLDSVWTHWKGPDGYAYHRSARTWSVTAPRGLE